MAEGKKLKKLGLTGNPSDQSAFRSIKVAKPACQTETVGNDGKPQHTTGPCQQAVSRNPRLRYTWFKTCTHGPATDADGQPIPEELRPYYEQAMEKRPIVVEGELKDRWIMTIQPRISQIALSLHTGGKEGADEEIKKGARSVSEFGLAPFCEYYNCYSQEVQKYKNGTFCSAYHAKMVKAREEGTMLCLPLPNEWTGLGIARRQKQLQSLDV